VIHIVLNISQIKSALIFFVHEKLKLYVEWNTFFNVIHVHVMKNENVGVIKAFETFVLLGE
jgi:hypothetical protein